MFMFHQLMSVRCTHMCGLHDCTIYFASQPTVEAEIKTCYKYPYHIFETNPK